MTRDFELIRDILFQLEKAPPGEPVQSLMSEADEATLGEHLELMIQAGLIEGEVYGYTPVSFLIRRLTWPGHDFLNNARNDTIWKRVMAEAKSKGQSVTLTILEGLLAKAAEKFAGLS